MTYQPQYDDWEANPDPAGVARYGEVPTCSICYATGPGVWGIAGYQLVLCERCRIGWRRGLGYPDESSDAEHKARGLVCIDTDQPAPYSGQQEKESAHPARLG